MSKLIPMPLTAVQKLRLLARAYDGVLVMQVCHFGLACKLRTKGFSIAFPIIWEVIENTSLDELKYIIADMALGEIYEKPYNSERDGRNA